MQVKVFEADDMRSALDKVKKQLGSQALILSSRKVFRKNRFGLPKKAGIEVTAAVDGDLEAPGAGGPENVGSRPAKNHRERFSLEVSENTAKTDDKTSGSPGEAAANPGTYNRGGAFETLLRGEKRGSGKAPLPEEPESGTGEELLREIREMRQSFASLSRQVNQARGEWTRQLMASSSGGEVPDFPDAFLAQLQDCGISCAVVQMLVEAMSAETKAAMTAGRRSETDWLEALIASGIQTRYPLAGAPGPAKKRMAFIGPTGVGKTTTIAKVAANYMLQYGGNIALATIDNYRIAAAEQLKIYGRIMNVPVETARTPSDLARILARHEDRDLVLVDTAGRSPKDDLSYRELADFLDPSPGIEKHLVLSATTREGDLFSAVNRFGGLNVNGLVFTKLDECDRPGALLNVCMQTGYPLSMLTNGQRVPEDFLPPAPRRIAETILMKNEVDEQWNTEENRTRQEHSVH